MESIKTKFKSSSTESKQVKNSTSPNAFLQPFMQEIIHRMHALGKVRTGETYTSTLNSFMRFLQGRDILWEEFDADLLVSYEAYLKSTGVDMNTVSFYNRILRAVYNRAVEKGLTVQRYPFKYVYTGIGKTVRRGLSLKVIRNIKDMAYLKKSDLKNGILSYRRKKTGQRLLVRWEKNMQEILDKYPVTQGSPYLLPIIREVGIKERTQYNNALHLVNRKLKFIGKMLDVSIPLTMYVARHSWASVAKNKNIPLSVISEGMGHDSENTTLIYLASLDTAIVDSANRLIINSI